MESTSIVDEVNDVGTFFLLKENKKENDILCKATMLPDLMAESLWHYEPQNESNI